MDGDTSTSDVEGKNNLIDAVLHTAEHHRRSKEHMELLKQRGKNAVPILCSDISSLESKSMDDVGSLHLIVDTCLYRILMDGDFICDVARRKFKELDKSGKRIYVLDTFQTELDDLIHQIPTNARTLWNKDSPIQRHGHWLPNTEKMDMAATGVAGGSVTTANTVGVNEGEFGNKTNKTSMVVHAENNYQIFYQSIDGKGDSSITVKEGSEPSSHNKADFTIKNAEYEEELFEKLTNGMDKLKSNDVHEAKTEKGSIIIRLTVDKRCIMTEEWIQEILKKIFHDILGNFFTEQTKFEVSVERHISMSVEDFLRLYSSHHSHDEPDAYMKKMVDDDGYSMISADSGFGLINDLRDLDYSDSAESMTKTTLQRFRGSKLSVSGYDIAECRKCETIVENTDKYPISETRYLVTHASANLIRSPFRVWTKDDQNKRIHKIQRRDARWRLCWKLKCLVSAMKNSGGGVVLVHIDDLERSDSFLIDFHEMIDTHLNDLLEDGCLFVNTFRVKWMRSIFKDIGKDTNDLFSNVVFVDCMPSESVTTVNYNTKVGVGSGIQNPTSEQIRRYLKTKNTFLETVPRARGLRNLQDCRNVEVRRLFPGEEWCNQDPCRLAEHIWIKLRLNVCVSALSKVEGGGSFYLGVIEPYVSETLLIEGFQYEEKRIDSLIAALRRQIDTDTLVLYFNSEAPPASLPQEYVEIEFHKVSQNRFVLEVAIAAVNGLVFHTKEGPEAYELDEKNMLHRLSVHEWRSRLLVES